MTDHQAFPRPGLYRGLVTHERVRPARHRLRYRVFSLLLDADRLPALGRFGRLLAHNRAGLFSIHDRDHGEAASPRPITDWVRGRLAEYDLSAAGARIFMLCYPRIFGYVFNPLTVFFCYRSDATLGAVVYEVHNTHGERHNYVLPTEPIDASEGGALRHACRKAFYVSPFMPMACHYRFLLSPPGDTVGVAIRTEDRDGLLLAAGFRGDHQPLSAASLIAALFRYPLMTVKVMVGIHWEALRLWRKQVPRFEHRPVNPAPATPQDLARLDIRECF